MSPSTSGKDFHKFSEPGRWDSLPLSHEEVGALGDEGRLAVQVIPNTLDGAEVEVGGSVEAANWETICLLTYRLVNRVKGRGANPHITVGRETADIWHFILINYQLLIQYLSYTS